MEILSCFIVLLIIVLAPFVATAQTLSKGYVCVGDVQIAWGKENLILSSKTVTFPESFAEAPTVTLGLNLLEVGKIKDLL